MSSGVLRVARSTSATTQPGPASTTCSLIYQAITDRSGDQVLVDSSAARGYGDLKKGVAEALIEVVAPIRRRYEELMPAPEELDRLLAMGAERARKVAEPKAAEIRRLVGFA